LIRLTTSLLILLLGVASGAGLAACGEEESDARLLPPKNANEIERNLADVQKLIDECNLAGARDAVEDVETEVAKVSDRIEPELQENLLQGTDLLREKIDAEVCEPPTEPQPAETTEAPPVAPVEEPAEEEPAAPQEDEEGDDGGEGDEGDGGGGNDGGSSQPPVEPPAEPPAEPAPEPPTPEETPAPPPSGGVGPGRAAGGVG
jgi:hypothetical protein